jgi:hypothetical protein
METDLLDAKQKTEFYRDKMQELVRVRKWSEKKVRKRSEKTDVSCRFKFRCSVVDDHWWVELDQMEQLQVESRRGHRRPQFSMPRSSQIRYGRYKLHGLSWI